MPPLNTAPVSPQSLWATSADGQGPDTGPVELDMLSTHLRHCTAAHSRLAALHCSAERVRGFVLSHLVCSVALLLVLPAAAWLLLAP